MEKKKREEKKNSKGYNLLQLLLHGLKDPEEEKSYGFVSLFVKLSRQHKHTLSLSIYAFAALGSLSRFLFVAPGKGGCCMVEVSTCWWSHARVEGDRLRQ